jgi:hypothetical protein
MLKQLSKTLLLVTLLSASTGALSQADVTSSNEIHLNYPTGMKSVFHVLIPKGGVLTMSVAGKDKIKEVVTGHNSDRPYKVVGNSAFVTFKSIGQYSVGAATECGVSFSVVVNVYANVGKDSNFKKSLPKVVIDTPKTCHKI